MARCADPGDTARAGALPAAARTSLAQLHRIAASQAARHKQDQELRREDTHAPDLQAQTCCRLARGRGACSRTRGDRPGRQAAVYAHLHGLRHGNVGLQYRRRRRQDVQRTAQHRRARASRRQRCRPPYADQGRPRAGLGDGHRRLLRAGRRARVRHPRLGPPAPAGSHQLRRLQRRQPRHRQGYRHRAEGPEGQARGVRGGCAVPQPERAGLARVRRAHQAAMSRSSSSRASGRCGRA